MTSIVKSKFARSTRFVAITCVALLLTLNLSPAIAAPAAACGEINFAPSTAGVSRAGADGRALVYETLVSTSAGSERLLTRLELSATGTLATSATTGLDLYSGATKIASTTLPSNGRVVFTPSFPIPKTTFATIQVYVNLGSAVADQKTLQLQSIEGGFQVSKNGSPEACTAPSSSANGLVDVVATKLALTAPSTATAGQSFTYSVRATDNKDNLDTDVTTAAVVAALPSQSPGGQSATLSALQFTQGAASGSATLVASGAVTLSITAGLLQTSASITVAPGPINAFTVTPSPLTLVAGQAQTMTSRATDEFGNVVASAPVWSTTCDGITQEGVLTATTVGSCSVMATLPSFSATSTVTVTPATLVSLTVTPATATLAAGAQTTLRVQGKDAFNNVLGVASPEWTSSCAGDSITATGPSGDVVTYTAPTAPGSCDITAKKDPLTSVARITVTTGPLARIAIAGPTSVTAGSAASFTFTGFDAYNNPVGLITTGQTLTPTSAGTTRITASESSIQASVDLTVIADALHRIVISGPSSLAAGEVATYTFQGFDRFDNPVALTTASQSVTAPPLVASGPITVEATQAGVTASRSITIVPDALATITVSGPSSLVADTQGTFTARGVDRFGNDVSFTPDTWTTTCGTVAAGIVTAPRAVSNGCIVRATRAAVSGTATFDVSPAALHAITVSGVDSLVVDTTATYTLTGADAYGNAVPLATTMLVVRAPTRVDTGSMAVTTTQGGVTGTKNVQLLPGPLATIRISGPTQMVAGTSATFTFQGVDAFENAVTLTEASRLVQAPTAVGQMSFTTTQGSVQASKTVQVIAGSLRTLVVSGPTELVAGTVGRYALTGTDEHGNAVALSASHLDITAPTTAGPATVCHRETVDGRTVEGCQAYLVKAAALSRIVVQGPTSVAAGTTASYTYLGYDTYGNAVVLSPASGTYTAPGLLSQQSITHSVTQQGVTGSLGITLVPAALASISITGPASLVAGTSGDYAFRGADVYGNAISLTQPTATLTAPVRVGDGPVLVRASQGDISAQLSVPVVAGALATLAIHGPAQAIVGEPLSFTLSGADAHGNAVTVPSSFQRTAPTTAGSTEITTTHLGVTARHALTVLAGPLATITIGGPRSVVAGSTTQFPLSGADVYANAVQLGQATVTLQAPTLAGTTLVSYAEQGISAQASVSVLAGPLSSVLLGGASTLAAGATTTFPVWGADVYGNHIVLPDTQVAFSAPTRPGDVTVRYTAQGIEGTKTVRIVPAALHTLTLSGMQSVSAGAATAYDVLGHDAYGNDVGYTPTRVTLIAPTLAGPAQVSYTDAATSIRATLPITVRPGEAARLELAGPSFLVAGTAASFDLTGFDRFDNELPTWRQTISWVAPSASGPASVTATFGALTAFRSVTVIAAPIASLSIVTPDIARTADQSAPIALAISATDAFGNLVPIGASDLSWTLSPPGGSVVNGALRATTAAGVQTLTATDPSTGRASSIRVTTTPGPLSAVTLSASTMHLAVTQSYRFVPTFTDAFGNAIPQSAVSWSVQPATTSFAPATGVFTATERGTWTLEVSDIGRVATARATVNVVTLEETIVQATLVAPAPRLAAGEGFVFQVTAIDARGEPIVGLRPTFVVERPEHGSITPDGVFTGNRAGVTDVIARIGSFEARTTVTVIPGTLAQISATPSAATLSLGGSLRFSAQGMDARRNVIPDVPISWLVADPSMGSVSPTGQYTAGDRAGAAIVVAYAGSITREIVVYQFITETRAPSNVQTAIDSITTTSRVANVDTTTHVVGLAEVAAGANLRVGLPPAQPQAVSTLRSADVRIERPATNVTISMEIQPPSLSVIPDEIGREEFDQRLQDSIDTRPGLFFSISATENGERLDSARLNSLLGPMTVYFTVAVDHFTAHDLDPTQVRLVEWSEGRLVRADVPAELVSLTPQNGVYEYRAVLNQYSTFAFIARPLAAATLAPTSMTPLLIKPALGQIFITGPSKLVAGSVAKYTLTGLSVAQTPYPLAQSEVIFQSTTAGTAIVRYEQNGIRAEFAVAVLPSTATRLETEAIHAYAGSNAGIRILGFDEFGNPVDFGAQSVKFTQAGLQTVFVERDGILVAETIEILPDFLARIEMTGPPTAIAGEWIDYALVGYDAYDNIVPLAQDQLRIQAPLRAGKGEVFYQEGSVEAKAPIDVVAGPLARIDVVGAPIVNVGEPAVFELFGFDAFGNPVGLERETLLFEANATARDTYVCYAERQVSSCMTVSVEDPVELHSVRAGDDVSAPSDTAAGFILLVAALVIASIGAAGIIVTWRRRQRK